MNEAFFVNIVDHLPECQLEPETIRIALDKPEDDFLSSVRSVLREIPGPLSNYHLPHRSEGTSSFCTKEDHEMALSHAKIASVNGGCPNCYFGVYK
ncbi:unnamed protein product [Phytophthora fragariaefolia]|uniref:Unnamed protein product n=1 Tax=Phytophthora fragariaefolia TaxID=1490495 RepID=A0A9W6XNL0_9STRA|nr:unnamed protein product [Phytophthora fragariaefolia]